MVDVIALKWRPPSGSLFYPKVLVEAVEQLIFVSPTRSSFTLAVFLLRLARRSTTLVGLQLLSLPFIATRVVQLFLALVAEHLVSHRNLLKLHARSRRGILVRVKLLRQLIISVLDDEAVRARGNAQYFIQVLLRCEVAPSRFV